MKWRLRRKKEPALRSAGSFIKTCRKTELYRLQVGGKRTITAACQIIANFLTFIQAVHSGLLDGGDVDEHVFSTIIRLNKAETLLGIEPFNGTGSHGILLSCGVDQLFPQAMAKKYCQRPEITALPPKRKGS
jgi:hypothetical protein